MASLFDHSRQASTDPFSTYHGPRQTLANTLFCFVAPSSVTSLANLAPQLEQRAAEFSDRGVKVLLQIEGGRHEERRAIETCIKKNTGITETEWRHERARQEHLLDGVENNAQKKQGIFILEVIETLRGLRLKIPGAIEVGLLGYSEEDGSELLPQSVAIAQKAFIDFLLLKNPSSTLFAHALEESDFHDWVPANFVRVTSEFILSQAQLIYFRGATLTNQLQERTSRLNFNIIVLESPHYDLCLSRDLKHLPLQATLPSDFLKLIPDCRADQAVTTRFDTWLALEQLRTVSNLTEASALTLGTLKPEQCAQVILFLTIRSLLHKVAKQSEATLKKKAPYFLDFEVGNFLATQIVLNLNRSPEVAWQLLSSIFKTLTDPQNTAPLSNICKSVVRSWLTQQYKVDFQREDALTIFRKITKSL